MLPPLHNITSLNIHYSHEQTAHQACLNKIQRSFKMKVKKLNPVESIINMINGHLANNTASMISELVKSRFVFTVECDYRTNRLIRKAVTKIFPRAMQIAKLKPMQGINSDTPVIFGLNTDDFPSANEKSGIVSVDYTIYRGTPIVFHIYVGEAGNNRGARPGYVVRFSTLRVKKHMDNLKRFINCAVKAGLEIEHASVRNSILKHINGGYNYFNNENDGYSNDRTFDTIFIPESQKKQLKESIAKFMSQREWYMEKHIPYHFGILLYGPPGTGKSSLVQAIANYAGALIVDYPAEMLPYLSRNIESAFPMVPQNPGDYRLLLIEDIDCGFSLKNRSEKQSRDYDCFNNEYDQEYDVSKKPGGLASILNTLDGILSPSNVFYVFTTNNIDKLDPALIRPGRIDLRLEIGYVVEETFKQFCGFYYGIAIKKQVSINRKELTCAELQTLVMKGYTIDQLIQYVEEEN